MESKSREFTFDWIVCGSLILPDLVSCKEMSLHFSNDGYQLCIPFMLHNTGAKTGMVTDIRISFIGETTHLLLDILGRVKLNEIGVNQLYNFDWDSFEAEGYTIYFPCIPLS